MTQTDEKQLIIGYNLSWFLLTGICLGLLAGLMISLTADSIEDAGKMAGSLFHFLKLVVFIELLFLTYKKQDYWTALLHEDMGQAIGQVIGMAIGGSFVVGLFFLALVSSIPYLVGSFDTTGHYTYLSGIFTLASQFGLVGIAVTAALIALGWLWWRQSEVENRD